MRPGISYADLMRAAVATPLAQAYMAETYGRSDLARIIQDRIEAVGQEHTHDYRTPDGRIVHVERRTSASGEIKRIARNVTQRYRERQQLAEAQEQLRV